MTLMVLLEKPFFFLLFGLALVAVPLLGTELPSLNRTGSQGKEEKNHSDHDPASSNVATGLNLPHNLPGLLYPAPACHRVIGIG